MSIKSKEIGINAGRRIYQYFLPGSSPYHMFDNPRIKILIDFETLPNDKRNYIVHLEMYYPKHADMLFSSYFEATVEDSFITEEGILLPIAEKSVDDFYSTYKNLCSEANIEFEEKIDLSGLVRTIVNQLQQDINSCIFDAAANHIFLNSKGLQLTPGRRTNLFLMATLMVNDQLFMLSPKCNRLHNRDVFLDQTKIPFTKYLDLHNKGLLALTEETDFNYYETIVLFNCTEIAVQILLSPFYDTIADALTELGLNNDRIKEYIKVATEIRKSVNESYAQSNVDYKHTIPIVDWPEILK